MTTQHVTQQSGDQTGSLLPPVRPTENFLVFGAPQIEDPEIHEVVSSMRDGWLGTGPKTARFEEDFRAYKGSARAIAVNSCTAAMHLSLLALGIGAGDEVITTALTFCSTVNTIIHVGATPVVVDIDPRSMNIDPAQIEQRITPRTRAIIPVHFAGRPCDMDAIMALARRHDLRVIEDCAHAIETQYHGRNAGTFGDMGCFSFYATKNVTTGEGGMVITNDPEYADEIKIQALHGMTKDAWKRFSDEGFRHYSVVAPGFKYNMMDVQAAIGIHQLRRVERNWHRRQEVWHRYQEAFADLPLTLPADPEPDTRHAYHLYTILIDAEHAGITRDAFLNEMTVQGIGVGVHYLSIPEHPFYREAYCWIPDDYPNAKHVGRRTASLPLSAKLTEGDVDDVITAVRRIFNSHAARRAR